MRTGEFGDAIEALQRAVSFCVFEIYSLKFVRGLSFGIWKS
jgi:hypothetical protein